jgi:protein SCO1/2
MVEGNSRGEAGASGDRRIGRRQLMRLALAGAAGLALAGCGRAAKWHNIDVAGSSPPIQFTLAHAPDGRTVTEADYRGKITMLYFGYTFCPDVCPTTLANIAEILGKLGDDADQVRVLFVTVDPSRDTLPVLAEYVSNFAPQIEGLRGDPNQLAALARRYRIAYSVSPETKDHPYEVSHSSAIYVFDRTGAARLLIDELGVGTPDVEGITADIKRLIAESA